MFPWNKSRMSDLGRDVYDSLAGLNMIKLWPQPNKHGEPAMIWKTILRVKLLGEWTLFY